MKVHGLPATTNVISMIAPTASSSYDNNWRAENALLDNLEGESNDSKCSHSLGSAAPWWQTYFVGGSQKVKQVKILSRSSVA